MFHDLPEQFAEAWASGDEATAHAVAEMAFAQEVKRRHADPFHLMGPPIAGEEGD